MSKNFGSKNEGSKNVRSKLPEHAGKQQAKKRRKPDQRIRRTHERLGSALVALIQERPIDDVTVQEVLDRAAVGRSTFYLHFRDKDDLLLSQLEKFLEMMSTALSIRKEESHRVVPVAELFAHIGSQKKLYRALADCGRLNDFFDLAQGYFARGIERRLTIGLFGTWSVEAARAEAKELRRRVDHVAHSKRCVAQRLCVRLATGHRAYRGMRWRIEVAGHLNGDPRSCRQLIGPTDHQLVAFGYPMQGGVAQRHIGIGLRRPGSQVCHGGIHAALTGGGDHLR